MALDDLLMRMRRPIVALAAALALGTSSGCEARGANHPRHSRHAGSSWASMGPPQIGYQQTVPDHNFRGVDLADKDSAIGRIQRTERWRNIIEAVEDKYDIPRNIIYAVIMQESYGDPLQPNATNDGGLGLVHFQPGTARRYGLHIFGNSRATGADHHNGRQIRDLFTECDYAIPCILKEDDRAQPIKNLDAIARYIKDGYARKKTWQGAVGTINPGQRSYAGRVWKWKDQIEKRRGEAARDFDQRNRGKTDGKEHPITFDHYTQSFLGMNRNFGLDEYIQMKR